MRFAPGKRYISKQIAPRIPRWFAPRSRFCACSTLATDRLRKAELENTLRSGLAEGLAHELNTPAQYIASNLAFMSDGLQALARAIEQMRQLLQGPELAHLEALLTEVDHPYLQIELPHALAESRGGVDHVASIVAVMRDSPVRRHKRRTTPYEIVLTQWQYARSGPRS